MILFQIILYLLLFTGMVAFSVRGGAVNALFFYPKPVQEKAFAIGLADRADIAGIPDPDMDCRGCDCWRTGGSIILNGGAIWKK